MSTSAIVASRRARRAAHAVGVAHEARDERVARLLVELARRAFLRDGRLVHHDDAVGDRHRLGLVVRDVDDRQRQALLQLADLLAHLPAQPRVQVRQRLVEQQDRGLEHERARDGHALLLAAGELGRQAVGKPVEADGRERRARALLRGRLRRRGRRRARSGRSPAPTCAGTARSSGTPSTRRGRRRPCATRRVRRSGSSRSSANSRPAIMRRIVVLPQPEGPSSVTSVPGAIDERDVAHGDDVAVPLAHVAEFDRGGLHGVGGSPLRRRCRRARRRRTRARSHRPRGGRSGARRRGAGSARSTASISTISTEL